MSENADVSPSALASDGARGEVKVLLVDEDGEPISACRVVLFAESVRSELRLAESTTDAAGVCELTYERSRPLSLIARAYHASGAVTATSATIFAAAAQLDIAITTAADGVVRTPSKLTTLRTAVSAQLNDLKLANLIENTKTHELHFLASASQQAFRQVAQLYIAEELTAQHGIRTETFFGLFAQAVPPTLDAALASLPEGGLDQAFCGQVLSGILAVSDETLNRALASAVSDNTLPGSYEAVRASEIALIDALRVAAVGSASFLQGKTPLTDILTVSGAGEVAQRAFLIAFADNQGQLKATWAALDRDAAVPASDLAALRTTVTLADLLRGNRPVLTDSLARLKAGSLASIADLAKLTEADWVIRLTALDPGSRLATTPWPP